METGLWRRRRVSHLRVRAPVGYFSKIVMGRTGERSSVRQGPLRPQISRRTAHNIRPEPRHLHHSRPVDSGPSRPSDAAVRSPCSRPAKPRRVLRTLALSVATAIGTAFRHLGFADSSIISSISSRPLLTAVTTNGRICTIVSSVLCSVLQLLLRHASVFARQLRPKLSGHVRHHVRYRYGRRRVNLRASPTTPAPPPRTHSKRVYSSKRTSSCSKPIARGGVRPRRHEPTSSNC